MATLYNGEGEEVEDALSGEELKELRDKAESGGNVSEYQDKIKELEEAKTKLEAKDMNFAKLRGKSKEEREALTESWSEEKKEMASELASMSEKIDVFQTSQLSSYENEVLRALAGDDEEYKTKIRETAKETLNMTPKNKEEILTYYQNAATLIKGARPDINPINAFAPVVNNTTPAKRGGDYTKTAEGDANYGRFFPDSKTK